MHKLWECLLDTKSRALRRGRTSTSASSKVNYTPLEVHQISLHYLPGKIVDGQAAVILEWQQRHLYHYIFGNVLDTVGATAIVRR